MTLMVNIKSLITWGLSVTVRFDSIRKMDRRSSVVVTQFIVMCRSETALPNQREALLLGHVVHTYLAHFIGSNSLAWLKEIYLESHFNLLGEGALGEDRLHLWHDRARDHAPFRSDSVYLLANSRHHRKVLREIVGHEAADTSSAQVVVQLGQI